MPNPDNAYENFDIAGAAADIGADLFPGKPLGLDAGNPSSSSNPDGGDLGAAPTTPANSAADPLSQQLDATKPEPQIVPGQNSANPNPAQQQIASVPMPKSWKKENQPLWDNMAPEAKAYWNEREGNFFRGIQQYKGGHDLWNALVEPFIPVLQQFPDVNPVQLMQGLMQSHLLLADPQTSQEKKVEFVNLLMSQYGISLNGASPDAGLIARLERAEQAARDSSQRVSAYERNRYEESVQSNLAKVEAFAADPKNKHYAEVENDIFHLIKTGAAVDLPQAYETACWANPVVRQKMIAEQHSPNAAQKPGQQTRGANGQYLNIDGGETRPIKTRPGTIDQTVDSIVAKHYPTKH